MATYAYVAKESGEKKVEDSNLDLIQFEQTVEWVKYCRHAGPEDFPNREELKQEYLNRGCFTFA